jgi:hypothetical protein
MPRRFWRWRRKMLEKQSIGLQRDPYSYGYKNLAKSELRIISIQEKTSRIDKRLNDRISTWRFPRTAVR